MTDPVDYRDTVFLPRTDFPMKAGLPAKEPVILAKWQRQDIYAKTRAARAGCEKFILHDGPPYANGDMHIGHALNHILKDLVVRTQSLLGKDAPYVPGWDCHGLPIEWKVEEQYRKKKLNKDEVPVKEFRAECRAYAQHWVDVQREQLKRLGVNGDWDNPYLTMDFQAEATIVSELLKFAESGQLYRGSKPVMWSCVEKTALAEAEVEYEDITSTQIDVAFEIIDCPLAPELVGAHAVIWTTTPWTIPVNQALAYGAEVDYVVIQHGLHKHRRGAFDENNPLEKLDGKRSLVAEPLVMEFIARWGKAVMADQDENAEHLYTPVAEWETVGKGSQLAGATARHPMAARFLNSSPFAGEGARLSDPQESLAAAGEGCSSTPAPPSPSAADADPPSPARGEGSMAEFFSRPRPFLNGSSFVTTEAGTGLVHMAPDHGEDDFALCKAHGIEPVFAVEADGKYRADWAWMGGNGSVINPKLNAADGPICSDLREAGALLSAAPFQHSYPHSWRSKAKLIYRCTPQWFVPMDKPISPLPFRGGDGGGGCPPEQTSAAADTPHPNPSPEGEGLLTLRETAVAAIAATRFVPEKGRNRISAMVEGRPDWVLSRQRAWGVPITLFVNRKTGVYLNDPAVNARIIAGVRAEGVDAWSDEAAQTYLGTDCQLADYERVTDILDVWFDSGCTHVFTLESGRWPDLMRATGYEGPPADLYLEGSDQHRGWFQSSLLESCGTRGRAPYRAVLTHGFTMDAKGMKMSKSLGNTINPLDLMRDYGADILRMWTASVDFTEDHRIGKEILSGVADQYRKLRNTFRYLLGALDGFTDAEKVPVAGMPELERYVLHLLSGLDGKLRVAVDDFDFNSYLRLICDFANNDLSAFFFDIRKDALYCEVNPASGYQTDKRRAYRTVLDVLFQALVRYAAPVLVFTAEEVWTTRFGADAESVHLLEWPEVDGGWVDEDLANHWALLRIRRTSVSMAIEPLRRDKAIGSSLEAVPSLRLDETDPSIAALAELFISAHPTAGTSMEITVTKTAHHKCGRCWRHLPEVTEDGALCGRCEDVLAHG
jgi:isoleucyl-tRNA synthetase